MARFTGKLTWYDSKRAAGGVERDEDNEQFRFFAKKEEQEEVAKIAVGSAVTFDVDDYSVLSCQVYASNVARL